MREEESIIKHEESEENGEVVRTMLLSLIPSSNRYIPHSPYYYLLGDSAPFKKCV